MPVFEVVPQEFDGSSDATDHLIKWGMADSIDQVKEKFPGCKVYLMDELIEPDQETEEMLRNASPALTFYDFDIRKGDKT